MLPSPASKGHWQAFCQKKGALVIRMARLFRNSWKIHEGFEKCIGEQASGMATCSFVQGEVTSKYLSVGSKITSFCTSKL